MGIINLCGVIHVCTCTLHLYKVYLKNLMTQSCPVLKMQKCQHFLLLFLLLFQSIILGKFFEAEKKNQVQKHMYMYFYFDFNNTCN